MQVASPFAFPVLPLLWEAQPARWMLTVLVKATFRLIPGDEAVLADAHEPLAGDRPWEASPGASMYCPTDRVPFKQRADVLLVGHAYAPHGVATPSVVTRLHCAGVDKSVRVSGHRVWMVGPGGQFPSATVPFIAQPLRHEHAEWSQDNPHGVRPVRGGPLPNLEAIDPSTTTAAFGPLDPSASARRGRLDDAAVQWAYRLSGPPPEGFDYDFFNAAPPEQRTARILPGAHLHLEHFHPHQEIIHAHLPSFRPRAMLDGRREIDLVIDTLWIDIDRSRLVLSWRGAIGVEASIWHTGSVAISADRPDSVHHPVSAGAPDPASAAAPPRRPGSSSWASLTMDPDTASPAKHSLPFAPTSDDRVIPAAEPRPASSSSKASPFGSGTLDPAALARSLEDAARAPLPFAPQAPERPLEPPAPVKPRPSMIGTATLVDLTAHSLPREDPALPFVAAPPVDRVLPAEPAPAPRPRLVGTGTMVNIVPSEILGPRALPFSTPATESPVPRSLQDQEPAIPIDARTDLLPIEAYARMKAALWQGAARAEVLRRHELDEGAWQLQEELQSEALAAEAREGRCDRALALAAALRAAGDPVSATPRHIGLEVYVALRVAIERAPDPAVPLEARGLGRAEWERIHRSYSLRARSDVGLRERLGAMLLAARARAEAESKLL